MTGSLYAPMEVNEHKLSQGVPSHKVSAMGDRNVPGMGESFDVEALSSVQGTGGMYTGKGSKVSDNARSTPPPVRVGSTRAQSAPDHGDGY